MPTWLAEHESVTIDPSAGLWRCRPVPTSPEAIEFRRELGLPTDCSIVMSGHQAAFWHAGIVAKVFALQAAADRLRVATAWVVVDQDVGEAGRVAYPVRRRGTDGGERLARAAIDVLPTAGAGVVTGRQPASRARVLEIEKGAAPGVAEGLATIAAAADRHAGADSAAMQVTRAAMELLGQPDESAGAGPPVLISALGLTRTALFKRMLALMRQGPAACAAGYNAAVARHPEARLRLLAMDSKRGVELPLWIIMPSGAREPAFEADLPDLTTDAATNAATGSAAGSDASESVLAPRALTMTALLRWAGCDLFIHGLGGGRYDPVMEEWLGTWLGVRDLAPAVVVSATRLMELVDDPPPTPEVVARARWEAHHARHNPSPDEGAARKREMAAAIRRASGPERARLFLAMHEWLAEQRGLRPAELVALDARATDLSSLADLSAMVFDRTWAFAMLPDDSLPTLRKHIRGQVLGGPA